MELRKEFQEIANTYGFGLSSLAREQIELAVRDCQELADRPPRELTDAEIRELVKKRGYMWIEGCSLHLLIKDTVAATLAKQREPQVVKFRAARRRCDYAIDMFPADKERLIGDWEWLDADGKPQIYEVRT